MGPVVILFDEYLLTFVFFFILAALLIFKLILVIVIKRRIYSVFKLDSASRWFSKQMTASETVSRITIHRFERDSVLDVRKARLSETRPPIDDYDPQKNRDPKFPIGKWMAYFNLVRSLFGAGVLGLPLATSQAGIALGPILNLGLGILLIHCHLTLLRSLNEISRQLKIPHISYRYGFRLALLRGPPCFRIIGEHGPTLVAIFMFMSQLGICTVYVIFTSDSLRDLMDIQSNIIPLLILIFPYLLMVRFAKALKIMSYVSLIGTVLNIFGMAIVVYQCFKGPHRDTILYTTQPLPLVFATGTYLFNMGAVGVILSIDKCLRDPSIMTKRFGIIEKGMIFPIIIFTLFGALGYWSFGTMEENVLRVLPYDEIDTLVAIGLYMASIGFAFPIQSLPAILIVIEVIQNRGENPPGQETLRVYRSIIRPTFVCLTFVLSYIVTFQGSFVAVCGNLCMTILILIFPSMMDLSLKYPDNFGKFKCFLILDVLIIIYGLVVFLTVFLGWLSGSSRKEGTEGGLFIDGVVGTLGLNVLCMVFPCMMDLSLNYPDNYGSFKCILIKDVLVIILGAFWFLFGVYLFGYLVYLRIWAEKEIPEQQYL